MHYPHPLIAREGWPFIAVLLVLAIGASLLGWAIVAVICWLVLEYFRGSFVNADLDKAVLGVLAR
jgi:phosphatidylserine decarboxylase